MKKERLVVKKVLHPPLPTHCGSVVCSIRIGELFLTHTNCNTHKKRNTPYLGNTVKPTVLVAVCVSQPQSSKQGRTTPPPICPVEAWVGESCPHSSLPLCLSVPEAGGRAAFQVLKVTSISYPFPELRKHDWRGAEKL